MDPTSPSLAPRSSALARFIHSTGSCVERDHLRRFLAVGVLALLVNALICTALSGSGVDAVTSHVTGLGVASLLGGGFGLLLGAMFADLLDKVLQGMFTTEITLVVVLASLITALTVGIFSGIYPAFKASRLNPVEALRYE